MVINPWGINKTICDVLPFILIREHNAPKISCISKPCTKENFHERKFVIIVHLNKWEIMVR